MLPINGFMTLPKAADNVLAVHKTIGTRPMHRMLEELIKGLVALPTATAYVLPVHKDFITLP